MKLLLQLAMTFLALVCLAIAIPAHHGPYRHHGQMVAAENAEKAPEFLTGLEPEDIMKAEVQPEDVSDLGMADVLSRATGKKNFQLDMKLTAIQEAHFFNPMLYSAIAGAA